MLNMIGAFAKKAVLKRVVAPTFRPAFSVSARRADLKVGATKHRGFPLCISKQKGLAINSENRAKIYLIEIKTVSSILLTGQRKNAGGKNEGIFHYVIENKWWKNVRNVSFHYVDENKYSYRCLSIILMKIKVVVRRQIPAGSNG